MFHARIRWGLVFDHKIAAQQRMHIQCNFRSGILSRSGPKTVGNLGGVPEQFRRSGGLEKEAEKDQADFGV